MKKLNDLLDFAVLHRAGGGSLPEVRAAFIQRCDCCGAQQTVQLDSLDESEELIKAVGDPEGKAWEATYNRAMRRVIH